MSNSKVNYGKMNTEIVKGLIDNAVNGAYKTVVDFKEKEFEDTDKKQSKLRDTSIELINKLKESIPCEHLDLLDDCCCAMASEWINFCRFYFREGVKAGLIDLSYLKENNLHNFIE